MSRSIAVLISIIFILTVAGAFARLPEEKSGTALIMKTLRGEPGGINPDILAHKRITRPSLPYHYDTPGGNFKIHYALEGYDAVDSVGYAYKIGEYMERCRKVYIDSLGYLPPPNDGTLGGDARYDVYLKQISAYGLTYPGEDGGQPWDDLFSYIEIENDFNVVYPNDDPDGPVAGAMRITSAHELHHAFQFGLYGGSAAWIAEMTSVSMEERMYPLVNDYVFLIDYLLDAPFMPINYNAGYHMYGMGLYAQYWDIVFGDGFLATVWDTMRFVSEEEALYETCDLYGTTLLWDIADFAAMALLVGDRDCGFFPDGAALNNMQVARTHSFYPASGNASPQPYGYGFNFIVFEGLGSVPRDLSIDFDGADGIDWGVRAAWKSVDSFAVYDIVIGAFGVGSVTIPFANEAEFIGLAIVPGGDFGTRYNFNYDAELVPASVVEKNLPDKIRISSFPNPFNFSCEITSSVPGASSFEIYDPTGGRVKSRRTDGGGRVVWDGTDMSGVAVSSGIYLVRASDGFGSIKITLLK